MRVCTKMALAGPRMLIEKLSASRKPTARGLLCMCVVGFRIQVLLNPSSTSQFIELPPLLLFYRLAEEDNRREMLARECFDPAASSLIAIELETTPKAPNANSQRHWIFALAAQ